ncbi:hypothetical protein C8J57DRAFT_1512959 [Mycena rebaudengoi]|nr:hypothetical protein C8J57DRAFT_1512959 [Mycena rebaudengoi]
MFLPAGPVDRSAVENIKQMLEFSQTITGNSIADQWRLIKSAPNWTDENTLMMMEEFFRGVTEYSALVFRACISAVGGGSAIFNDGVPLNMTIPTSGTYHTQTIGWSHISGATFWAFIPGN